MTDTAEVITIGAVALLVVKEAFAMVRTARQRNGHGKPDPSTVTKETAPEFWLLQNEMKAALERNEDLLREVRDEVLDSSVRKHHRN